jgi:putative DNA primase/helicase
LILLNPPIMPPIPTAPTKDHAAAALALLDGLLAEFPFTDKASRSVALSELICPVVRGAMAVVPLHANRAPVAGTGKSYIVDVSSVISSGQPCPTIAPGCDEFELEKRLGAALVRGQAMVSIDNVNGELRGDFLCQVVERPIVRVRPLGFSNLIQIESKTCVYATGNNLILVGDIVRRTLLCSLDPQLERPELRRFKSNPVQAVLANRGVYIAAALTVVRAYLAAGYPGELPALASFEDWSRLVRSALVWLGHADPVQTMETAREEDPELDALRRVYRAWNAALGPQPITTGALVELGLHKDYEGKFTKPELHDALMEIAWSSGALSPKKLGHWLKRYRNRIVSGLQLASAYDTNAKQHVWRVRAIGSGNGTEG